MNQLVRVEFYRDEVVRRLRIGAQPFPLAEGVVEPILTLQTALGPDAQVVRSIHEAGKIVFHAAGDTGSMLDSEDIYAEDDRVVTHNGGLPTGDLVNLVEKIV